MLGIPGCFPANLMHLISLNLTNLLIKLWRGTMDCEPSDDRATWDWAVLQGDTWKDRGKSVADATPYLPRLGHLIDLHAILLKRFQLDIRPRSILRTYLCLLLHHELASVSFQYHLNHP